MNQSKHLQIFIGLAVVLLCFSGPLATKVQQMNLQDLVERSALIFRGTVVDIDPGMVEAGGGQIPTTTYRIRVDEGFKGVSDKGVPLVDITMVGSVKVQKPEGAIRRFSVFDDVPRLKVGGDYLLFTTPPSSVGLSTTVGLIQGCFRVFPIEKQPYVVNGLDNLGLFRGLERGQLPESGPISYAQLTARVEALMGQ